jgi:peptidoglycan/LPS O-acetylase OafA/YrhL
VDTPEPSAAASHTDPAEPVAAAASPRRWITLAEGLDQRQDNFLLLRFLAAALVIYGHGYAMTVHAPDAVDIFVRLGWGSYSGAIGVDLFFVVSGFLVSGSFLRRRGLGIFIWARALRLLPAFAVCLLLSAFVLGAIYTQLPLHDYLLHPDTRGYVLANLRLGRGSHWDLPGVFLDNPRRSTVNGSIWTLPIEVRMYAWIAFVGGIGLLARRGWASAAIVALLAVGWFTPGHVPLLTIPGSPRLAAMFAIGALCYLHRERIPVHGALPCVLAAACWLLAGTWAYPIAFALAETAFVFWFAYRLRWYSFNRFGDYSYGMYLWGFPIQQVVAQHFPHAAPWQNSALALPAATFLGVLSWRFVEKPALVLKGWSPYPRIAALLPFGRLRALSTRGDAWLTRRAHTPLVAAFALAASAYLLTSLVAIANFALRYPAFDQYRLYPLYLGLPFPQNALQLENGHRPILPALLRLAEIRWFGADQQLQVVTGIAAALLALTLIAWTVIRDRNVSTVARAGACALAVLTLFWLGNARMLMHGNESVHAYFVVLFSCAAMLAVDAARRQRPALAMLVASLCCVAATFSFGTGMASFGSVLVLVVVLRLRTRELAIPAVVLALAAVFYLVVLPGDGGVRESLHVEPLANLLTLTRWLAAPWMYAWLGNGDPPLSDWMQTALLQTSTGQPLVASARWIDGVFGAHGGMTWSALIGACGLVAYACILLHAWRVGRACGSMRVLGLGLATFALGAAAIVCLARLHAFTEAPEQVFADRYLPWSCLFWLGLALYALAGVRSRDGWRTLALAAPVGLVLLVFAPSHRAFGGWSATVYRHIQQSAVAAQLGIWDAERFPDGPDASRADVLDTLARLRAGHLSMFAEPAAALLQPGAWHVPAGRPPAFDDATARVVREFDDPLSGRHVADFEGWMPRIEGRPTDPVLVVVDAAGALRGVAKTSFIGFNRHSLRLNIPQQRGFDGYVLDPRPGETLSLLVLDAAGTRALAAIAFSIPPDAPDVR